MLAASSIQINFKSGIPLIESGSRHKPLKIILTPVTLLVIPCFVILNYSNKSKSLICFSTTENTLDKRDDCISLAHKK